ncbi:thiol reductase thioredoxin [Cupriavidus sp. USMAA2-4]|uniref:Thiol reductase thioredoxin n=1 Tax=Cupriavidus malaysiensis TaxID=367825 RepID=A0ABM6F0H2_9BURK|nr:MULTISPECIES: thioredoxin domain-containing protein [Cupriavidus]AOY92283.1 thiol reductase thioredoxin [Cupriavidus sp. USMAA2-4]AOY98136.1 thiol reductase thioredoxin [Cupriavidus sp. USMAHM13]AOZ04573.1 thiol reductase thioredoxin [Cupriavidus malaysiensis]
MTVYLPERDADALAQALSDRPQGRLVACLCAAWCRTCGEYQAAFAAVAAQYPRDCFVWIDVETHADRLGDLDIENFPTILVQPITGGAPQFYGTLLPHAEVLQRMLGRDVSMQGTAQELPDVLDWLLESRAH